MGTSWRHPSSDLFFESRVAIVFEITGRPYGRSRAATAGQNDNEGAHDSNPKGEMERWVDVRKQRRKNRRKKKQRL